MTQLILENVSVCYPLIGVSASQNKGAGAIERPIGGVIQGTRRSNTILALQDISLNLQSGDQLGIVGHNGSGKSTLLRTMAGIYAPTAGRVCIEGSIGTLFNTRIGVQVNATGRENIILSGLMHGLTRKQALARYPAIADFSELGKFLDFPLSTYSRGMAMRLAFAMATEFDPQILLLDEWLGAGDQSFRDKAQLRMRELVEQAGIIVLASHRLPLIRETCNQCLWLEHGKARMLGPTKEVLKAFREDVISSREKVAKNA